VGYGFRASTISGVKGHGVLKGLIKSWCIKGVYSYRVLVSLGSFNDPPIKNKCRLLRWSI
jgi:hypothetical protein